LRDTFLEDNTPTDLQRDQDVEDNLEDKDAHELLFSSKHAPRLSMFDNMLQSLDRISDGRQDVNNHIVTASKTTAFHNDVDIRSRYNTMTTSRHRGRTMSSSVSSENDGRKENTQPLAARSTAALDAVTAIQTS
jgi:hypothetical protein